MATLDIEQMKNDPTGVNFLYLPDIPEGIAGLIAGKVTEVVGKPSIIIVKTETGILKASCRSKGNDINL